MAGHRQGTGKPRRRDQRTARFHEQMHAARTGKEQLGAAFDYFRVVAYRHPAADDLLHEAATYLATRARQLEAA